MTPRKHLATYTAVFFLGVFGGAIAINTNNDNNIVKVSPTVIISFYRTNTLQWKIAVTNSDIWRMTESNYMKFDWKYGQLDNH